MSDNVVLLRPLQPTVGFDPQRGPMLHLFGGRHVYPFTLKPEEVSGQDIVRGLSKICRFGSACVEFYSVAQHSCLVADCVPSEYEADALLHDASEAYIGDIVRPIKQWLDGALYPTISSIENGILRAIYAKAGRDWELHAASKTVVKNADNLACVTEARDLMGEDFRPFGFPEPLTNRVVGWDHDWARGVYGERLRMAVPGLFE